MAVVSVAEKMEGTRTGSIDRMWVRTYVRTFHVETDNPRTGAIHVRAASGIPQIGHGYDNGLGALDPNYENDPGSYVNAIECSMDQDGSGLDWTVTVNYGPFVPFDIDPSQWPIKVSFGGERTERVIYTDKAGNPITNSAGDRFDPPVTIDDSRSTMTVTRNELVSAFDLTLAETYRDTINNDVWNGFAARTVKLGMITTSEPQYDSNARVYYYTVTYPFVIDRKKWQIKILDAGCNELDAYSHPKPIMNNGQQVSDPVALDGSGHCLNCSGSGGTPVFITVDAYDEIDFSGLSIDLSLRLGH